MSLQPLAETSEAAWLQHLGVPPWTFLTYGPPGYPVYVRLRILDDGTPSSDVTLLQRVLDQLATSTATPDDVFVGVWEGWGHSDPPGARFSLPYRTYALLRGPIADALDPVGLGMEPYGFATPHLIWPADRAWFVSFDVDEETHFTVAGDHATIAALLGVTEGTVVPYGEPRDL